MPALRKTETAGVTLNPKKCEFGKSQVKSLGHFVDREGIRPDLSKISAITGMEPPTNVSELHWFMGMVNVMEL